MSQSFSFIFIFMFYKVVKEIMLVCHSNVAVKALVCVKIGGILFVFNYFDLTFYLCSSEGCLLYFTWT